MKKILLFIILAVAATGCQKDFTKESSLEGEWLLTYSKLYPVDDPNYDGELWYPGLYEDDNPKITVTFKDDGTVITTSVYPNGEGVYHSDPGEWEIVDGYLYMELDGEWIYGEMEDGGFKIERKSNRKIVLTQQRERWISTYTLEK